jgi:hypothetical protein
MLELAEDLSPIQPANTQESAFFKGTYRLIHFRKSARPRVSYEPIKEDLSWSYPI